MAAAVASFNVFGAVGVTAQLNLQEVARGNADASVSYNVNNNVSVALSGSYNAGTETGEGVSNRYAETYANYAPYTVDRQVEGFGAGVAGNYFFNSNTESSFFAGAKLSFARGQFATYETEEVKGNEQVADGDKEKKEEKKESKIVRNAKNDRETTLVRLTAPAGYQWVSGDLVVSSSVELGASYDVNAKEKAFRPHVEASLLSVGMKF